MSILTHCRGLSLTGQIHPHYSKISFMNNLRKDIFMLNKNSIQPLYKQLMDIITQQIKNGTYKPGEKIPYLSRSLPIFTMSAGSLSDVPWRSFARRAILSSIREKEPL